MKSHQYFSPRFRLWLHVAVWLLAFLTPYILRTSNLSPQPSAELDPLHHRWPIVYFFKALIWTGFFYLNVFILIPQLVKKQKTWQYVFTLLGLLVAIHGISFLLLTLFIPNYGYSPKNLYNLIYYNTVPFVFVLAGCFIMQLYRDKANAERLFLEEEKRLLLKEIKRMRAKVSPQFVHNALDTLRLLWRTNPPGFENSTQQLLGLMDYMLYDTGNGKISLALEVENLQKYLAFFQQYYAGNISVSVADDIAGSNYEVEHLVLLHYMEDIINTRHLPQHKQQVDVHLYTKNNLLNFIVSNNNQPAETSYAQLNGHAPTGSIRKLIINTYQKEQAN